MESAYNHILEAVALYACPVFKLVGRYVLHIARNVVAGVGVGAVGSDGRHKLVVLVRDEVACCYLRYRVDFVVQLAAHGRVGYGAVVLVAALYVVEIWLLLGIVGGSEAACALKHKMLKIVGKTRSFGWVVA